MKIRILGLGKLSESYHMDLVSDGKAQLMKRLGRGCEIEVMHLKEELLPTRFSESDIKTALDREAERILAKLEKDDFLVCLDIEGRVLRDPLLEQILEQMEKKNKKNLFFAIGSSYGLSQSIKKRADLRLSFGSLTLNHQIVPALLLDLLSRSHGKG
ncbi:MAG: 23S rRNA (pseudouridine(1915)-N(3))-methyltransferase RlmH [Bacillota bacterium]|nr:23S rRNA (pseudouridine(1915)-N(3))-methyltransferase RlmH [Bacillota bacterium]